MLCLSPQDIISLGRLQNRLLEQEQQHPTSAQHRLQRQALLRVCQTLEEATRTSSLVAVHCTAQARETALALSRSYRLTGSLFLHPNPIQALQEVTLELKRQLIKMRWCQQVLQRRHQLQPEAQMDLSQITHCSSTAFPDCRNSHSFRHLVARIRWTLRSRRQELQALRDLLKLLDSIPARGLQVLLDWTQFILLQHSPSQDHF